MIQRIQSIYLLVAAAALGLQFVLPYATAPLDPAVQASTAVFADGRFNPLDNMGLLGLSGLGAALALAAIFMFKNRPLQGRLSGLTTVVSVLALALAGFVFFNAGKMLPAGTAVSHGAGWALPVVAAACAWLAQKAIGRDENLVRSMNRLRD